jgi:hypothetical protein
MKRYLQTVFLALLYAVLTIMFLPFLYEIFAFFEVKTILNFFDKMPKIKQFINSISLSITIIIWITIGIILATFYQKIHRTIGTILIILPILSIILFIIWLMIWVLLGNDL